MSLQMVAFEILKEYKLCRLTFHIRLISHKFVFQPNKLFTKSKHKMQEQVVKFVVLKNSKCDAL